jgi:hypothetical protein
MSEAVGKWGVRGLVEWVRVPVWCWEAISACVRAVRAGERLKEEGEGLASGAHGTRHRRVSA